MPAYTPSARPRRSGYELCCGCSRFVLACVAIAVEAIMRIAGYDTYNHADLGDDRVQQFKMVYFADYAAASSSGTRGLTIPFSTDDAELYQRVAPLSSHTIRRLIGFETYGALVSEAAAFEKPVATHCRDKLRSAVSEVASTEAEGLQATFAGGRGGTLHEWYPYLEGYSPAFVTSILKRYGTDARCVFDPFAGAGTTPVTSVSSGLDALYSEVNPLCSLVTSAKLLAVTLTDHERRSVVDVLRKLADNFEEDLAVANIDGFLEKTYTAVFGDSRFFDNDIFGQVLKARNWLDEAKVHGANAALFSTIAILRSLVPASRLIRRGDLRFKNATEAKRNRLEFVPLVRDALSLIASDLEEVQAAQGRAHFIGHDAKELDPKRLAGMDSIITSPPYLNGTNYFRNTKVELWFLRELKVASDLTRFRFRAITAGINDVTVEKAKARAGSFASEKLNKVISQIEQRAYDRRIPQMVSTYFGDLFVALQRTIPSLNKGNLIAIDIGDSCYGGIHVPTDDILSDMLHSLECTLEDRVVLRERLSRGGQPLRQTLQVFRKAPVRQLTFGRPKAVVPNHWKAKWAEFKATLPHQHGEMARRNWGHPLHSLCSYQGKLKPAIANLLVGTFVPENGRILDPFAGVGTIPLEAALTGRTAYAFDISPPALHITNAKIGYADVHECEHVIEALEDAIHSFHLSKSALKRANQIKFNGPLPTYFHHETLREIMAAREFFARHRATNPSASLVFSSLLHILHGNRPYALSRTSHPITPFAPTGPTTYKALIPKLREKIVRSFARDRGPRFRPGKAYMQDATNPWPAEISDLDAIITSPPFFDSTRFHTGNWMRLWFAGWEASDFKTKPFDFIDERQKRSFEVYAPIFTSAAERIKRGGLLVLHLGKSVKCDMASELTSIGSRHFELIDSFVESVIHCESHGIRDKGTVTHHQYLVFQME